MFKRISLFASVCLTVLFLSAPSNADTDYQCLTQCVNGGKPSSTCLNDCSYNVNVAKPVKPDSLQMPTANKNFKNNHNVFTAPMPVDNTILLPTKKTHNDTTTLDWTCMSACLQPSQIYAVCEKQCTRNLNTISNGQNLNTTSGLQGQGKPSGQAISGSHPPN